MSECVWVGVRERKTEIANEKESKRVCVCLTERGAANEAEMCVSMCVLAKVSNRERERERKRERERERERGRERERERAFIRRRLQRSIWF